MAKVLFFLNFWSECLQFRANNVRTTFVLGWMFNPLKVEERKRREKIEYLLGVMTLAIILMQELYDGAIFN